MHSQKRIQQEEQERIGNEKTAFLCERKFQRGLFEKLVEEVEDVVEEKMFWE